MNDPAWRRPREALDLAIRYLDCGAKDAGDWLVDALHNELRRSRATLAKVLDSDPPREIKGQDIPKGLWHNPKPSGWVAEHAPPVAFGWSFWNTGNRTVIGARGIKIELVGVEIDMDDILVQSSLPVGAPVTPTRRGRPKGVGSFAAADAPLIDEMREMLLSASNQHRSPTALAWGLVGRAEGSGTQESKVSRLVKGYGSKYPD